MKQPKPMVGQVWRAKGSRYQDTIQSVMSDGTAVWSDELEDYSTVKQLGACWEFVPQNDLEWLACNVDEWGGGESEPGFIRTHIYRLDTYGHIYSYGGGNGYTRKQWQNTRYRLGLDDKPKVSAKEWAAKLDAQLSEGVKILFHGIPNDYYVIGRTYTLGAEIKGAATKALYGLKGDAFYIADRKVIICEKWYILKNFTIK